MKVDILATGQDINWAHEPIINFKKIDGENGFQETLNCISKINIKGSPSPSFSWDVGNCLKLEANLETVFGQGRQTAKKQN